MVDVDTSNTLNGFSGLCAVVIVKTYRSAHGGTLKGILLQLTHSCHQVSS